MKIKSPYLVRPNTHIKIARVQTSDTGGYKSEESAALVLVKYREKLAKLQEIFSACQKKALLIRAAGHGYRRQGRHHQPHLFRRESQGCDVTSFKVPTPKEALHDFLWRAHAAVPPRGMIGIFNRSHYEDALSPRVHKLITDKVLRRRLDDINAFEEMLANNGRRYPQVLPAHLPRRADQPPQSPPRYPGKQWKLSEADIYERKFWPQYEDAYNRILSTTSHKTRPVVHHPLRHQVVPQHSDLEDTGRGDGEAEARLSPAHDRRRQGKALKQSSPPKNRVKA